MKVLFFALSLLFALLCYIYPKNIDSDKITFLSFNLPTTEQMCLKILERTSSANESKIIINNRIGGLGHKSISVVEGIIYALISGKQLWCMNGVILKLSRHCSSNLQSD